ncbi:unnamed protein product [Cuscuta europaea]|uniref:Uncharacterized protein n=1 Tax=Cuscuta europaea TaxID=41803 RepID=A0A9P0YKK7_CUSEU|nr:unnamed protein product [Cuscuta europaea]
MGTREVYEERLRTGNLHHDPTIKPGLGSARCPRCLSLLNPTYDKSEWTITPVLHDFTAVAGSVMGGMLSTVYGLNTEKLSFRYPLCSEACQGIKVASFYHWGSSTSDVFCS